VKKANIRKYIMLVLVTFLMVPHSFIAFAETPITGNADEDSVVHY